MSEHTNPHPSRDAGLTLTEVVIVTAVIGILVAVMSSAVVVTLRQAPATGGRLNVARAEQNLSMWMPSDLTSAETVDGDPGISPCGAPVCDGIDLSRASNVVTLTWVDRSSGAEIPVTVSYVFAETDSGEYELWRVECKSGNCSRITVLNDLPGPPGGEAFVPGITHGAACSAETDPVPCTRPDWVLIVTEPLAPDAVDDEDGSVAAESERKNASRVIVTINGGGEREGAGGGSNEVSITAGGTERGELSADSLQGVPSFVEARSRCGGAITLIIDESSSIGSAITEVRRGVRTFVEALAGTPIKLQLVRFARTASVVGSQQWHEYFDMNDQADVRRLLKAVDGLVSYGGTNWEEGLFHTFFEENGNVASVLPDTVVFFTDGVPTFDRLVHRSGALPALPPPPGEAWPVSAGNGYSQIGFERANYIAARFRGDVRMIGVGVGSGIAETETSEWIVDPGAAYVWQWQRSYRRYQRTGEGFESNIDTERGLAPQSRVDFERRNGSRWRNVDPATYYANNTADDDSDGWRINGTRKWYKVGQRTFDSFAAFEPDDWRYSKWADVTITDYLASNKTDDDLDGFRINGTRDWEQIDAALYDTYNTTADESDGWRRVNNRTIWVSKAEYEANNTTPDASDGWIDTGVEEWVSAADGFDWAPWTGKRRGGDDQYRRIKVYGAPAPYDGFDDTVIVPTKNRVILSRLISGSDNGTPAIWNGQAYTNVEVADMYVEPDWQKFPRAMRAIALGECGGTLTIRTNLPDGTSVPDSFRYQNTEIRGADGIVIESEPTVVTTSEVQPASTFDFSIAGGDFLDAVVVPQNSSELDGYSGGTWACSTGLQSRPSETVRVEDGWNGVRVRVGANEAVSCTFTVRR